MSQLVTGTAKIVGIYGESAIEAVTLRYPLVAIPACFGVRASDLMASNAVYGQHLA
jgi:hypothetical protein